MAKNKQQPWPREEEDEFDEYFNRGLAFILGMQDGRIAELEARVEHLYVMRNEDLQAESETACLDCGRDTEAPELLFCTRCDMARAEKAEDLQAEQERESGDWGVKPSELCDDCRTLALSRAKEEVAHNRKGGDADAKEPLRRRDSRPHVTTGAGATSEQDVPAPEHSFVSPNTDYCAVCGMDREAHNAPAPGEGSEGEPKLHRNESTEEYRKLWRAVDRAADRAPSKLGEGEEGEVEPVAYLSRWENNDAMLTFKPVPSGASGLVESIPLYSHETVQRLQREKTAAAMDAAERTTRLMEAKLREEVGKVSDKLQEVSQEADRLREELESERKEKRRWARESIRRGEEIAHLSDPENWAMSFPSSEPFGHGAAFHRIADRIQLRYIGPPESEGESDHGD